jgi:hypothetical protein
MGKTKTRIDEVHVIMFYKGKIIDRYRSMCCIPKYEVLPTKDIKTNTELAAEVARGVTYMHEHCPLCGEKDEE